MEKSYIKEVIDAVFSVIIVCLIPIVAMVITGWGCRFFDVNPELYVKLPLGVGLFVAVGLSFIVFYRMIKDWL